MIKRLFLFSMILAMVKASFVLIPSYKKMKVKSASRIQSLCKAEVKLNLKRILWFVAQNRLLCQFCERFEIYITKKNNQKNNRRDKNVIRTIR